MNMPEINIFWFRRDLRLTDNCGLYQALSSGKPVLPVFIFDTHILSKLEDPKDLRVQFIHQTLEKIQATLKPAGSGLQVFYGEPLACFLQLSQHYRVATVYTNHDYEPYARERDDEIALFLKNIGIDFKSYKDQVIFEKKEVVKDDGNPYTVFTPYARKWKAKIADNPISSFPSEKFISGFLQHEAKTIPSLESMGFQQTHWIYPDPGTPDLLISNYSEQRNFPAISGTSQLGIHLRFGTISVRKLAAQAQILNETYLNELIWRDFYHMILYNFPQVGRGEAFKKDYDKIKWLNNEADFEKWCTGQTGYPIVDAGMRELKETGFMHNRVRMIVASFLTKHLLIDWRWGEAWFAAKLLDFDLAANNGGWQWAAGSGCDAAPYFRVFNPTLQAQKFDSKGIYIKKWVPEFDSLAYVQPMVNHDFARKRCLSTYSECLKPD
jgi:deoxyribodipyrimidine photo-lyase